MNRIFYNFHNPWKILYWKERVEQLLAGEIPDPIVFTIDPSSRCNLSCEWCFTRPYMRRNPVDLPPELFHDFIDSISGVDVRAIALCGGGEPLMNPETPAAIEHISSCGIRVGLITNGTRLDERIVRVVLRHCDYIRISIDAHEQALWEQLHRGTPDLWGRVIEGIQHLVEAREGPRPTIGVSYLVCPANYKRIPDAAAFFKSLGVDYLAFKIVLTDYPHLIDIGYSGKQFFAEKNNELWELFQKAEAVGNREFRIIYRHPGMFMKNEVGRPHRYYKKCRATPLGISGLASDGTLYCCCDRREAMHFGRFESGMRFEDLWRSDRHREALDNIDITQCPDRCCAQETNQIIEYGFVEKKLEWDWTA